MFGISYGIFVSILTVISQLLAPHGYDQSQSGILGVILMLCGVGGAAVFGVVLDLTRKYTFPLFLGNFCSIGSLLFFYTQVKADNFPALAGACACMGFFFISGLPVSMETGVELTFPVGEAVSSSFLILSGNVFVVIFTVLFNVLQQGPSMDFPLFVSLCCCAGAFSLLIIYILLKPIYRR